MSIPADIHCEEIDQSKYDSNRELTCLKCSSQYLKSSNQQAESICQILHPYQKELDTEAALKDICELRHPDNNLCLKCPQNFIFDSTFQDCVEIPTGVPNCQIYLTESVCSWCSSVFYLDNNQCKLVLNFITNCSYYESDGICSKCLGGFEMNTQITTENNIETKTTSCIEKQITNCLTYNDFSGLCSECISGHYLVRENKKTTDNTDSSTTADSGGSSSSATTPKEKFEIESEYLHKCREKSINNCFKYADNIDNFFKPSDLTSEERNYFDLQEFPEFLFENSLFRSSSICSECENNFFLSDNQCQAVVTENQILNCLEYSADDTCERCNNDFILSIEK